MLYICDPKNFFMQNKLQEITDKLYQEGLVKGKDEAQLIITEAEKQAASILEKANQQAEQVRVNAEKQAKDIQSNAMAEIKMAGRQMMTSIKTSIEGAIIAKTIAPATRSAFEQTEFVKELVKIALTKFSVDEENQGLTVLLPKNKQTELENYMSESIGKILQIGLNVQFDEKLQNGLKIQSKGDGYWISLTDADFVELFKDYIRPKLQEILY